MRFVSLFAGVGGFDLGFENVGWTCVGQVEIDKNARAVLDQHWPDVPKHDDVQTAKEWANECDLVGSVDLVCGGFPCQDVSVAGKRAGLAGERTGLFWDALSFATHVQAEWLVLENVPGLLSSNQGRDFGVVLSAMADAGYRHIEWRVLDSQFLGVAQRRRRVFIVGHTRTPRSGAVLVEREGVRGDSAQGAASREDIAGTVEGGVGSGRSVTDSLSLSLSLANSSSMQNVASTVTTGTGVRYDPDTESLVVLSQTRSER
jgi:DNA (cytosine-5)-methyltransferase 1